MARLDSKEIEIRINTEATKKIVLSIIEALSSDVDFDEFLGTTKPDEIFEIALKRLMENSIDCQFKKYEQNILNGFGGSTN
jgi:hypothetical protein